MGGWVGGSVERWVGQWAGWRVEGGWIGGSARRVAVMRGVFRPAVTR